MFNNYKIAILILLTNITYNFFDIYLLVLLSIINLIYSVTIDVFYLLNYLSPIFDILSDTLDYFTVLLVSTVFIILQQLLYDYLFTIYNDYKQNSVSTQYRCLLGYRYTIVSYNKL
jgi:hypothetical protein